MSLTKKQAEKILKSNPHLARPMKAEAALALLTGFVNSEWGTRFENDESVCGADFVDYGGDLYRKAKEILDG